MALDRLGDRGLGGPQRDARGELQDLVLGRVRHVPEGVLLPHGGDQQFGAQRRVLLDVELAPDVAEDLDLADVQVAGLDIGLAVLGLGRAEHGLDLDAVVVERGGDTGEGDDVLRDGLGLGGLPAVVLEAPRPGVGALGAGRAGVLRVAVTTGSQHGTQADGAAHGEQAAAGGSGHSGSAHDGVRFRTSRSPAGDKFERRLA